MPLQPARLAFLEDGTPYSETFGDIYHAAEGGAEQAQDVFLEGSDLPARWRDCERFCIVETGFGMGLNFLSTWAAWRATRGTGRRLHYVAFELHPFEAPDLATLHARWPQFDALSRELLQHWPTLTPGIHRIHLDHGDIVLTLLFGDAVELLPQLECAADAFYLDGFSPARNPDLWTDAVFARLGELARPGATIASWTVAGSVRRSLGAAGFNCHKTRGRGAKREILRGHFAKASLLPAVIPPDRRAIVVGAGLAGSSIANRLAQRGWDVVVIDAAPGPGEGASGNLAGVLRPLPARDDNRLARLTRAGFHYAVHHLERLADQALDVRWDACGVLHLARDAAQEAKQRDVVLAHAYPPSYLQYVDRAHAAEIARWPVSAGGWWFPGGAWVNPASLCRANLEAWSTRIRTCYGTALGHLARIDQEWSARDTLGREIASAPVVILANGIGITGVPQASALPVRGARGQVSHLPAEEGEAPAVVVCRSGYVSPVIEGVRSVGATFDIDDDEPRLRPQDHCENLSRLAGMLPGMEARVTPSGVAGRVGFRPTSPDRLPMVGAVPLLDAAPGLSLAQVPRYPGLHAVSGFGARGLVWAALSAELLASRLEGDPLPLERDLIDAIDPARYCLRPSGRRARDR